MFAYAGLAALIAGSALVRADPVPTAPGPGDVFTEGGQCTFTWTPDTTGTWTTMNVELMSGSNLAMEHITTVASLDGTSTTTTSFSYACPQVTPNSAIYFYQFSSPVAPANLTWTTRFTIAAADGSTTDPANSTQPDGSAIPWGSGALVDETTASAAPTYITGEETAGVASGAPATTEVETTSAPTTTSAAPVTQATTSVVTTAPAAPSTASTVSAASNQANTTASSAADNGALSFGVDGYLVRAGVALGVAAMTFAIAL